MRGNHRAPSGRGRCRERSSRASAARRLLGNWRRASDARPRYQTNAGRARSVNAARARQAAWPRWLRCRGGPALWRRKRCSRACARRRMPAQALAVRRGLRQSTIRRPRHEASGSAKAGYVLEQAASWTKRRARPVRALGREEGQQHLSAVARCCDRLGRELVHAAVVLEVNLPGPETAVFGAV